MSTTNSKYLSQSPITSSALPIQTVFRDENVCLGEIDWIFGVVGGKVHLGDTGDTSILGSGGRIRGGIRVNAHSVSVQSDGNHQTRKFSTVS